MAKFETVSKKLDAARYEWYKEIKVREIMAKLDEVHEKVCDCKDEDPCDPNCRKCNWFAEALEEYHKWYDSDED